MVRKLLRESTREAHDRLDQSVTGGQPLETVAGYGHYLDSMRKLYRGLAHQHDWVASECGLEQQAQHFAELILSDLMAIGYPATTPDIEMASPSDSESFRWGVAYTLEGSAMGAMGMFKHMKSITEFEDDCRYLEAVSSNARNRWPTFCEHLESSVDNESEVVAGATFAFEYAYQLFSRECS